MCWIKKPKLKERLLEELDKYSYVEFIKHIKKLLNLKTLNCVSALFADDFPEEYFKITEIKCKDQKYGEDLKVDKNIVSVYIAAGSWALFKGF